MSAVAAPDLREVNRRFYDALWRDARLIQPQRFNTWSLVDELATGTPRRLEIAPGLRPRLPIAGTAFADISAPALRQLGAHGGHAVQAQADALPYADDSFDLLCAFDIIEHIEGDEAAMAELARVAAPGAVLLLSVPIHMAAWTVFDEFVGHHRRYEPEALLALLARHGFATQRSAAHGMQPESTRLLKLGMWFLTHQRQRAMWWYNHVFMRFALDTQAPLALQPGMIATDGVDTVLLVCRKAAAA
ncbi:methyltransferase family protein [Luteimonas cucumeris]|uniref:Methyltransferase family protein n=1 Tax=Luteimonas cucumeris TaxID=985012 RepID=A0A562LA70_9GAMM|nr:methyltransferase domain-containing protein [Luteimonas cucumeris]TWI04559.1 methyltransferase family protein [Luteimonas cucumeris]